MKNKAIVDEAEKLLKDFKPVTYDVSSTIKAIEAFEAKAVGVETTIGPGEKIYSHCFISRSRRPRRPSRRLTSSSRSCRPPLPTLRTLDHSTNSPYVFI